jgi:hypothetical protein
MAVRNDQWLGKSSNDTLRYRIVVYCTSPRLPAVFPFFALSGFLLTHLLTPRGRRNYRVLPPTAAVTLAGYAVAPPKGADDVAVVQRTVERTVIGRRSLEAFGDGGRATLASSRSDRLSDVHEFLSLALP